MNATRSVSLVAFACASLLSLPARAQDACQASLDRLGEAVESHGLKVQSNSGSALKASSARLTVDATCQGDNMDVTMKGTNAEVLVGVDGTAVSLETRLKDGTSVYRDIDVSAEDPGSRMVAGASSGEESAQVIGDEVQYGDPDTLNRAVAPKLRTADIQTSYAIFADWSGLTDQLRQGGATEEEVNAAQGALGTVPVPAGAPEGGDSDHKDTNKVCVASAATCIAGLISVLAAGACAPAGILCLAAAACELADCSGDGYN